MKRFVSVVLVFFLALCLVPALAAVSPPQGAARPALHRQDSTAPVRTAYRVGRPAPVVSLAGLDGKTYTLGGKREKPLLINFWVSWCGPCLLEAPDFQAVYEKYGDRIDLYGVNVTQTDRLDDVRRFVDRYGIRFPVLLDTEAVAADAYRVSAFPTSFLLDRDGTVRDRFYFVRRDELEKRIAGRLRGGQR